MAEKGNDERSTNAAEGKQSKRESGNPGGGQGRRDDVGRSGVYPMSGPHPAGNAPIRTEGAWGQGERGAAGYEDDGSSELSYEGGQGSGGPAGEQARKAGPGPEPARGSGREIPRGEWLSFLDGFSRQHEGWLVTLEVPEEQGRSEVEAQDLKLEGITPEHSEGHDRISIALGKEPDDHLTHFVSDPIRLTFMEEEGGGHLGLQIEAADGSRTVVRFRGPARPESLNDVAA